MLEQISQRLKQLGEFRDSFLVLAGSVYILGYIVRSINALKNNLGLLPAFEAQYFIAGIAPALILILFGCSIWCIWQFKKRFPIWLDSGKYKSIIAWLFLITYLISAGVVVINKTADKPFLPDDKLMIVGNINLVSAYLFFSFLFMRPNTVKVAWNDFCDKKKSWLLRLLSLLKFLITVIPYTLIYIVDKIIFGIGGQIKENIDPFTWFTVVFIVLYTISGLEYFVSDIYPKIPQELGGEQPRCAYLDVISEEVSSEIQAILLPSNSLNTDIAQSIKVDVYFASSEFLLVKPHNINPQNELTTYEIQKNVIQAITWCK